MITSEQESPKPAKTKWHLVLWLSAGLLLFTWLLNTPPGLLGKTDAIGYAVCHQIDERTFYLGERPLPLCARCSGMFLASLVGLIYQALNGQRRGGWPAKRIFAALAVLVLAFAFDGVNSYVQYLRGSGLLYQTSNTIRAITGAGMGVALASVLYPTFIQTVWKKYSSIASIGNWRQFACMSGLSGLVVLFLLSGNPLILYPLSLLSAAGVLVMMSMLYAMIYLTLSKNENQAQNWYDLVIPLLAGFVFTLLQISLLDFGRFWLTGTWEGFPANLGR